MKRTFFAVMLMLGGLAAAAQPKTQVKKSLVLKNAKDSASYALGVNIIQGLKKQGLGNINPDILVKAINNELARKPHTIAPEACSGVINQYMQQQRGAEAIAAKEAGRHFLQANAKKQGVISLPSGLQYQVIRQGEGPKPTMSDKVKCHYHGTLIDGTIFDSSVERGEPAVFPVSGVIRGWTEALQLMPTGSKWRLFIPSDLAYGDNSAGPKIGPGSTLIFDVELLEIVK